MWSTIVDAEDKIIKKTDKTILRPGTYTLVGQQILKYINEYNI